jgi:hypothetical protein
MRIRHAALAVLTLLPLALAVPAQAAPPDDDPVACTIVDTSPDTIVLGTTSKKITFDVGTDCDDSVDVSWSVQAENYYGSAHVSWLAVCNYQRPADPAVFDCNAAGATRMNMVGTGDWTGNDMAGITHPLYAYAFNDADGDNYADNGESADHYSGSFILKRQTTFGSSFNASPEPRRRGQNMNITAQIQRANWDTGHYEKYGTYLSLQFRPEGSDDYSDVKTVWDNGASATTTVKARRSGWWRYHYDGSATEAASDSKADYVKVSGAHGGDVAAAPVAVAKPRPPKTYVNCDAMHKDYPHGVAKKGAKDIVRGHTKPVTTFAVYTKMYAKNTKSDRDHDGVACEKL